MLNNPTWLYISLYCNKSHWNNVLQNGIAPFFRLPVIQELCEYYDIEFNHIKGDNIRLTLLTQPEKAEALSRHIDGFFKNHLIQYGLFDREQYQESRIRLYNNFRKVIADLILTELAEEIIDEESILLFAFTLHMFCLLVMNSGESIINLQTLYDEDIGLKEVTISDDVATEAFEGNKDILREIVLEVFTPDPANSDMQYRFANWRNLCIAEASVAATSANYQQQINDCYKAIFHLINKQLAITDNMALLLFYFILHSYPGNITSA